MDNSIGATPTMPRNMVNDNRDQVCSSGLHFCGREYLTAFNGARTVVVKINPKNVVSIPTDYNNAKGRACTYEIVQEIDFDVELERLIVAEPAAVNTSTRAVKQMLDGDVIATYPSVSKAAEELRIRQPYIERVLSGDRKATGGFGFEWGEAVTEAYGLDPNQYPGPSALDGINTDEPGVSLTGRRSDLV